eukprot:TRINITY_DN18531_c0_g1_i2.p1 TRINITY_DN18531_c0_g1~~TRINITY_DN18531_c0_g1_i2.p1  ORF type:complete len:1550 (+),score=223.60 TRINITY_DN18531_c0_g1_i2:86-4735(+)
MTRFLLFLIVLIKVVVGTQTGKCPQIPCDTCDDVCTSSRELCTALRETEGCPYLRGLGCCECSCPTPSLPVDMKKGSCSGKDQCMVTLSPYFDEFGIQILEYVNLARATHGACPLAWNDKLASKVFASSEFNIICNNGQPDNDIGLVYIKKLSVYDLHNMNISDVSNSWFCKEASCWDFGAGSTFSDSLNFPYLVWSDASQIGCSACQYKTTSVSTTGLPLYESVIMCRVEHVLNASNAVVSQKHVLSPGTAQVTCPPGQPLNTLDDECESGVCGMQSCIDSDRVKTKDYVCYCPDNPSEWALGKKATCSNTGPSAGCSTNGTPSCDVGQTCADFKSTFKCTCDSTGNTKVGGPVAQCPADECLSKPCGLYQGCEDPNNDVLGDYICSCGLIASSVGSKVSPVVCPQNIDECELPAACGIGQICNDPSAVYGDYTCTCLSDSGVIETSAPIPILSCPANECDYVSCGPNQYCRDDDYTTQIDYTCTCLTNYLNVNQAGSLDPVACPFNECDAYKPCSPGQTCSDPKLTTIDDYVCTCNSDTSFTKVNGSVPTAVCPFNECIKRPCGVGNNQICNDPNLNTDDSFLCTCGTTAKMSVGVPLSAVDCPFDECDQSPCGPSQACSDPNTSVIGDYECRCNQPDTIKTIGRAIPSSMCRYSECLENPCGPGQNCSDPSESVRYDFVCKCNGIQQIGAPVLNCPFNECEEEPCGPGQDCSDLDLLAVGSYECVCGTNTTLPPSVGAPAPSIWCPVDECNFGTPCNINQLCYDGDSNVLNDFRCSCPTPPGNTATSAPTPVCSDAVDECAYFPCKPVSSYSCIDTNKQSYNNYICTCLSNSQVKGFGVAPDCGSSYMHFDECADPASCDTVTSNQTCRDPNKHNGGDFVCYCPHSSTSKEGGVASCVNDVDECLTADCGPVSVASCVDPDYGIPQNYICSCNHKPLSTTAAKPNCSFNECDNTTICSDAGQTCEDPDIDVVDDFICRCPNSSTHATASKADCISDFNECLLGICGSNQTCKDPDFSKSGNVECWCKSSTRHTTGGPVDCTLDIDECSYSNQCGIDNICNDPDYSIERDYLCQCKTNATNVRNRKRPRDCEYDECSDDSTNPCGDQLCEDTNLLDTNTVVCTCKNSTKSTADNQPASCPVDMCLSKPCGSGQQCVQRGLTDHNKFNFECYCDFDFTISANNKPATCLDWHINECDFNPDSCGPGQKCEDPSPAMGDFICSCTNSTERNTGGPVNCYIPLCNNNPCGPGQHCSIINETTYSCNCTGVLKSLFTLNQPTTCNECLLDPCNSSSTQQTCIDTNSTGTSLGDYLCRCENGAVQLAGPANCSLSGECRTQPCITHEDDILGPQRCNDPNLTVSGDFECWCAAPFVGVAVGSPAICISDECDNDPCGSGQTCTDFDKSASKTLDFMCTCDTNGVARIGSRADCDNDKGFNECFDDICPVNSTCVDTNPTERNTFYCRNAPETPVPDDSSLSTTEVALWCTVAVGSAGILVSSLYFVKKRFFSIPPGAVEINEFMRESGACIDHSVDMESKVDYVLRPGLVTL